ncbi:calcium-activated potassium channel subunit alpha-1 [Cricetulus griseus]|uniref:Calcium-activated potassium channel subunit alpha-1 n=1 Tax=Cricetulus griseus TaxID=10029 RepID=A0A061IQN9_CRIGR|nr:calcium-activated potassium channel subunit alpha-1 [Cricetulus griseus]
MQNGFCDSLLSWSNIRAAVTCMKKCYLENKEVVLVFALSIGALVIYFIDSSKPENAEKTHNPFSDTLDLDIPRNCEIGCRER